MIGPFMYQWLRGSRWVVGSGAALLFFLAIALHGSQAASAATITVTNTNDTITAGDGVSLREAVQSVGQGSNFSDVVATGAYGTNDTIFFNLPAGQVIVLTNGTLVLARDVTINGPGASALAVDGGCTANCGTSSAVGGVTVFQVNSGVTVTGVTANLSGLTIRNGKGKQGGGIYNLGTLTVTNAALSGNSANIGGGYVGGGGGIYNDGTLTVTNSTLSGNSGGDGGGIYNSNYFYTSYYPGGGTLTVTNSTLSGNSAVYGGGGGIYNDFSGYIVGPVTVTNSTLSGNDAVDGGGIYNAGSTVTLINAIVANSPTGGDLAGTFGGGNNLIDDTSGASGTLTGSRNITGKPALLAPLGNYGGPTETIALLPGSPAIDAGDDTVCAATGPGTVNNLDQRGVARPVGRTATLAPSSRKDSPSPPALATRSRSRSAAPSPPSASPSHRTTPATRSAAAR